MADEKKGQGIVLDGGKITIIPFGVDVVEWMTQQGYKYVRHNKEATWLRPELQNQPEFEGLCGPMWGGDECPLRYEDWDTYEALSR